MSFESFGASSSSSSSTNLSATSSTSSNGVAGLFCRFCYKSGLTGYDTHSLKDNLCKVSCPVLRKVVCKCCGCTGDQAHTLKYCPTVLKRIKLDKIASFGGATGNGGGEGNYSTSHHEHRCHHHHH